MYHSARTGIDCILDRNRTNDRCDDHSALRMVWFGAGADQYIKNNRNYILDRWSGISKTVDQVLVEETDNSSDNHNFRKRWRYITGNPLNIAN